MWDECVAQLSEAACEEKNSTMHGIQFDHLMESLLNQYSLSLGDLATENYGSEDVTINGTPMPFDNKYTAFVWVVFIFASLISNVIIINIMIAIACDTYDRVASEDREVVILVKKASFLADYVWGSVFTYAANPEKYIYTLIPTKPDDEHVDPWQGTVKEFKMTVGEATTEMQNSLKKEIASVKTDVSTIKAEMEAMIGREFDAQKQVLVEQFDKTNVRQPGRAASRGRSR